MQRSDVQLVAQVGRQTKQRLLREAGARGVELSALVRAILDVHLSDVGEELLGWVEEGRAVVQIDRPAHVELEIPRRRITDRAGRAIQG